MDFYIKNMGTFERMPFQAQNAVFKKLAEITDISALSKEDRNKYDESIKKLRDYQATMNTARKGRLAEGREEGRKEGAKGRNVEITKNLLGIGLSIQQIIRTTGLTEKKVRALKN